VVIGVVAIVGMVPVPVILVFMQEDIPIIILHPVALAVES
jgi:hypothetical protein